MDDFEFPTVAEMQALSKSGEEAFRKEVREILADWGSKMRVSAGVTRRSATVIDREGGEASFTPREKAVVDEAIAFLRGHEYKVEESKSPGREASGRRKSAPAHWMVRISW